MKSDGQEHQDSTRQADTGDGRISRGSLLKTSLGAAALAGGARLLGELPGSTAQVMAADSGGNTDPVGRAAQAFQIRVDAAQAGLSLPYPEHLMNGDETLYASSIGNFSKGLPHNALGEVSPAAYQALLKALAGGKPADFEAIPLGGSARLVDPQAAYAFTLEGPDAAHIAFPASPPFNSAEAAGELVELYWQALSGDVPFTAYAGDPLVDQAAQDLSRLADFHGPKHSGKVTVSTLFRGETPGDLTGPYLSQLLWQPIPQGTLSIPQQYRTTTANSSYLTSYREWLDCQRGLPAQHAPAFDTTPRLIRCARDLAIYVRYNYVFQPYLHAALILLGKGAPLDAGFPYRLSTTQQGFGTFGAPHILDAVTRVANVAQKASWYQKWLVHRRLRPEAFAGRVHNQIAGAAQYPIYQDVLTSAAIDRLHSANGTALLPICYPEGCPLHPAYPAAHATIAGACVTVLKAFFDENYALPQTGIASADGLSLHPYSGAPLTVGGELNKLASNMSLGRNAAGVHWRSDGYAGKRLGEAVALGILADWKATFHESYSLSLTTFDGQTITI